MFRTKNEAEQEIRKKFPSEVQSGLIKALCPAISFLPLQTDILALGVTKIAGKPDMGEDIEWPSRLVSPDFEYGIVGAGKFLRQFLECNPTAPIPFEFVAQVNLEDAATLPSYPAHMPAHGRLLFFYASFFDGANSGRNTCRVIWDQNPTAQISRRDPPAMLEKIQRQCDKDDRIACVKMAKQFRSFRQKLTDLVFRPSDDEIYDRWAGSTFDKLDGPTLLYAWPDQPMRLVEDWRTPESFCLEIWTNPDLTKFLDSEISIDGRVDRLGLHYSHLNEVRFRQICGFYPHQFLGYPDPVQNDPRLEFQRLLQPEQPGENDLEATAYSDVELESASEWCQLLQVDLAAYRQLEGEGSIYFLIRKDDLAQRNFDNAVAIYQQT